jgi:uncharacterized RDD family membrane protein YckC
MERVCRRDGTASSPTTGEIMNADETYIAQVIAQLPPRDARLREQVAMELRSHIAERVEHGQTVEDALRQFGDPIVLAESYLAAIPLIAAPFWPRAAARLIDFFGVLAIVAMPIIGIVVLTLWREQGFLIPIAIIITIVVVSILSAIYPVIAEYRYGKTVGKHLMGLRVVRESGARISFGQAVVRQLPMLTQVWWIDMLFALFTDKHQRAFEMLSKTRVVVAREEQS